MKSFFIIPSLGVALFLVLFAVPAASAQQRGATPVFTLDKFHLDQPKSPDFKEKSFSYTETSENWLQMVCEYQVTARDGWLDNITFKWNILLLGAETERLVFTKSITYDKIEADGKAKQKGVVYLSPRDIRRYYSSRNAPIGTSKVVIYVEILSDGIKVGEFQYPKGSVRGVPAKWWQSPLVNRVDNVLLSRTESPWFGMDHDTWVPERPSEKPVAK
ncbi:MAG: Amuc_1102 family pilus-like protein [Lentisphaeria bacterium]|nr:Amuc_1102 family pilus-like protein [Lentisphaeria bacterium]